MGTPKRGVLGSPGRPARSHLRTVSALRLGVATQLCWSCLRLLLIPLPPQGWGELPADTGLRLFMVLGRPKGIRDQAPRKMVAWGQTGVLVPEKRTQSSYWGGVGSLKQTPTDPNTDGTEAHPDHCTPPYPGCTVSLECCWG